jgi:hypothetical protein
VTGGGYFAGLAALILSAVLLSEAAWPIAVAIAFCTGFMQPPVSQISRALWPRLAKGEVREALYTLDSTGSELVAMGGPLVAAGVVTLAGGTAAVGVFALLAAGGAVLFGLVLRTAGLDRAEPRSEAGDHTSGSAKRRSLLRDPVFLRAILIPFFLMAALFSVNFSLVGWGRDRGTPGVAGGLLALFDLGSAIGGLLAVMRGGKRNSTLGSGGLAIGIGVVGLLLPPVREGTSVWLLAVVIAIVGTVVTPSLAAGNSRIGDLTPEDRRAEAFGWLATATAGGAAIMLPISGRLLDLSGPAASIGAGVLAALVAAILAATLPKRPSESKESGTETMAEAS